MAYSVAGLTTKVNAVATAYPYVSAHTADPGASGANEVSGGSYVRQLATYAAATGSGPVTRTAPQVSIPMPTGATTVTHYGHWSASTGGTFGGGVDCTDQAFSSGGNLLVTPTLSEG